MYEKLETFDSDLREYVVQLQAKLAATKGITTTHHLFDDNYFELSSTQPIPEIGQFTNYKKTLYDQSVLHVARFHTPYYRKSLNKLNLVLCIVAYLLAGYFLALTFK